MSESESGKAGPGPSPSGRTGPPTGGEASTEGVVAPPYEGRTTKDASADPTGEPEERQQRAAGRRVARIGVRIGARHRVVPDVFEQTFQHVAAGGVAEGATTEIVTVAARATCGLCGTTFETAEALPDCPSCAAPVLQVEGGDEVVLEWVQYHAEPMPPVLPVHAHANTPQEGGDGHVPGHSR